MVFEGSQPRSMSGDLARAARRKLRMIEEAADLGDLRSPPGNLLEALRGDRAGRWSVRINRQWRVTFAWRNGDAHDVLIEDYH